MPFQVTFIFIVKYCLLNETIRRDYPQEGLTRQPSHSLHHGSTRDGSYQSTPDEQLSVSIGGLMGGRAPSESDLSSNVSDDVLVTPGNKLNGVPVQTSSSLVSTDNEVSTHSLIA